MQKAKAHARQAPHLVVVGERERWLIGIPSSDYHGRVGGVLRAGH